MKSFGYLEAKSIRAGVTRTLYLELLAVQQTLQQIPCHQFEVVPSSLDFPRGLGPGVFAGQLFPKDLECFSTLVTFVQLGLSLKFLLASHGPSIPSHTFGLVFLANPQVSDRYEHIPTQAKLKARVMIGQPGVMIGQLGVTLDMGTFKAETHLGNIKAETHLGFIKAETHLGNIKAKTHLGCIKAKTYLGPVMFAVMFARLFWLLKVRPNSPEVCPVRQAPLWQPADAGQC